MLFYVLELGVGSMEFALDIPSARGGEMGLIQGQEHERVIHSISFSYIHSPCSLSSSPLLN